MKSDVFKRFDNWDKQKQEALFFIARLKSCCSATLPCYDYPSALSLAQMIVRFDTDRMVKLIHVHGHYVEIERNEKGSFAFAPVILDHYERKFTNQTEVDRP